MSTTITRDSAAAPEGLPPDTASLAVLIARLGERAAYATGDEYAEIRALMTALRGLLSAP